MERSGDLFAPSGRRAGGPEAPRRAPVVLDGPPDATRAYVPIGTVLSVPELSLRQALARAEAALVWLGTPEDSLATPTVRFDRSHRRWLTFVLLDTGRVFAVPVADWGTVAGAYEVVGLAYGGLGPWRRWEPVLAVCVPWVTNPDPSLTLWAGGVIDQTEYLVP